MKTPMEPKWLSDVRKMMAGHAEEPPLANPAGLLARMERAAEGARRRRTAALWARRLAAAAAAAAIALPATRTLLPHIPQPERRAAPALLATARPSAEAPALPARNPAAAALAASLPASAMPAPRADTTEARPGQPSPTPAKTPRSLPAATLKGSKGAGSPLPADGKGRGSGSRLLAAISVAGALTGADPATRSQTALLREANPIGPYPSAMGGAYAQDQPVHSTPASTHTHHSQPLRLALTAAYRISPRWAVEAGLAYSYLRSETETEGANYSITTSQRLHYIGLPVAAIYTAWGNRRLSLYAKAGAMAEKMVGGRAQTSTTVGGESSTGRSRHVAIGPLQLSATAALGAEWHFANGLGLYAEPGITYHFDSGSDVSTFYSDNPVAFSLTLGLRVSKSKEAKR